MSERSERFRAAAKRRRDAGFIDGSTDGEGLCDDIESLEAKVSSALGVAEWIRDNYGDYISREIEERLRAALGAQIA